MRANEYELIVIPGRRPIWKTILATLFFSYMIYLLYGLCLICWYRKFNEFTSRQLADIVEGITYALSGGVFFSVMKTVLIDVDKDKLVSRFFIGPFQRDILTKIPELDYVAVFRTPRDYFQVNLWYKVNKHYQMYTFDDQDPAFKFAEMVRQKLKIDLLDATEKGNFKWIEKPESESSNPKPTAQNQ